MNSRRCEDRLQWSMGCAETLLRHGERGDDRVASGVRMGVLANKISRRYRLNDTEAIDLATRALDKLVTQDLAECDAHGSYHRTPKLMKKNQDTRAVVLSAAQWRALGFKLPAFVPDTRNLKNVREDERGVIIFANAWD